jgi:hypothetical protein
MQRAMFAICAAAFLAAAPASAHGFQASYVIFPTPGCWEVTGRVGDASITFVLSVIKIGDGPSWRRGL